MKCSDIALGMKNCVNILESSLKFLPKLTCICPLIQQFSCSLSFHIYDICLCIYVCVYIYYKYIYLHFLKQGKNLTYGNNRNQNIDYLWWWKLFTKKWAQRNFPGEIFATFQIKMLYLDLGDFCVGVFKRKYSLNTQLRFENFATCKFYLN